MYYCWNVCSLWGGTPLVFLSSPHHRFARWCSYLAIYLRLSALSSLAMPACLPAFSTIVQKFRHSHRSVLFMGPGLYGDREAGWISII